MKHLYGRAVLSFGEIVWDIFSEEKKLGGAPLNFAYYINKLGGDSRIISAVGDDGLGAEALKVINSCGIQSGSVKISRDLPTGRVIVSENEAGLPCYNICSPAAWDNIQLSADDMDLAEKSGVFVFGSLAQRTDSNRSSLRKIISKLPPDAITVFDANIRQNFYSREIIDESMKIADIVKMNEDEFPLIAGLYGLSPADSHEETARKLMGMLKIKYLLLTLGKNGSIVYEDSGRFVRREGHPIKIVDTVGAGDSFTAAFVWNICCGKAFEYASEAAANLSERVCGHKGAFCL